MAMLLPNYHGLTPQSSQYPLICNLRTRLSSRLRARSSGAWRSQFEEQIAQNNADSAEGAYVPRMLDDVTVEKSPYQLMTRSSSPYLGNSGQQQHKINQAPMCSGPEVFLGM